MFFCTILLFYVLYVFFLAGLLWLKLEILPSNLWLSFFFYYYFILNTSTYGKSKYVTKCVCATNMYLYIYIYSIDTRNKPLICSCWVLFHLCKANIAALTIYLGNGPGHWPVMAKVMGNFCRGQMIFCRHTVQHTLWRHMMSWVAPLWWQAFVICWCHQSSKLPHATCSS